MKINNLTNGLVATLLLASPIVGAETEYPAADFKPKVIYQDSGYSSKSETAVAPAAKVSVETDAKYPAADFEPKVLYKDADYKPSKFTATSSTSERTTAVDTIAVSAPVKAEEESMMSYLLGLVVFAVAGYVLFGKRDSAKATVSSSETYSKHVSGLSGVARYLRRNNMVAATGVARYLESQVATAKETVSTSGVEKYLERQAISAKEKAAQAGTGVEKYMRNRG